MHSPRRKKIIILATVFIAVFAVAHFAVAQINPFGGYQGTIESALGLGREDPRVIIANTIRIALGFLGLLAVVLIIYAGWLWMTAAGRLERIEKAKKTLIAAAIGLLIILAAFGITTFVLNSLLNATGAITGPGPGPGPGPLPGPGPGPGPGPTSCDANTLTPACEPDALACAPSEFCNSSTCLCQPGGGPGDPCDGDTATPVCEPNNARCAAFLTCNTTSCVCEGAPVIEWLSPIDLSGTPNGAVGNFITIGGRYFGTSTGAVYFWDGTGSTILAPFPNTVNPNCNNNWSDNQIIVIVPAGAVDGPIRVQRADGQEDTSDNARGPLLNDFDVNAIARPGLCLVNPGSGYLGDVFNLQGISFNGVSRAVLFGNEIASTSANNITGWSNTSVSAAVPNIRAGAATVFTRVDNQNSNVLGFTVLFNAASAPLIDYIDPAQGPRGQYITIYGRNFRFYQAGLSRVQFYNPTSGVYTDADIDFPAACQGRWWSDSAITVKVPNVAAGAEQVIVTNRDSQVSPPADFTVTAGQPGPGLCLLEPHNGPVGQSISAYGDLFGAAMGTAQFYNNQAGSVTSWANQQAASNVPNGAETGPFRVINSSGDISNSLPFTVGNCVSSSECFGTEECCPGGSYWAGICRLAGSCGAGGAGSCGYGWTFSTALSSVAPLTCGGYSNAAACAASGNCPNSPGQCQTNLNAVLGQCSDSFCNSDNSICGNNCVYDAAINKCKLNASSCDASSTTILTGYTAECRRVGSQNIWQIDTGNTSCPLGSFRATNNWCSVGAPGSPVTCALCANGFACQNNECVINRNVCPSGSTCTAGECRSGAAGCECCCRVGYDAQDCCAGLTCSPGGCGAGAPSYGLCTGCKVELDANPATITAAEQTASNQACNCSGGTATRICDLTNLSVYPSGVCRDAGSAGASCDSNPATPACEPQDTLCLPGLYCNSTSCTCQPTVSTGSSCDSNPATPACEPDNNMCALTDVCNPSSCVCEPIPPSTAGPGDFCQAVGVPACVTGVASCPTNYACLNQSGADCRCCCTPGTIIVVASTTLECIADQTPCSGSTRGLYCGCSADGQCGSPVNSGCGLDTCCRSRPTVVSVEPPDGATDVCRNPLLRVTFDQEMDVASFSGNVIVAGDYGTGRCPKGTTYLTLNGGQEKTGKLAWLWQWIKKALGGSAQAIPGNFCAVSGTVAGYNDAAGQGVLIFSPAQVLDDSRIYYAIIKGDSNVNDAVKEGVLSRYGIGLNGPDSETFNALNYSGRIWSFTTRAATAANDGICRLDYVQLDPASYLFQTSRNDTADDVVSSPAFDTIADSDKAMYAYAKTSGGENIAPLAGVYNWSWNWSSENQLVARVTNSDNPRQVVTAQNRKDAKTYVNAKATISQDNIMTPSTVGRSRAGRARIYVFQCANPWPPVINPANWPWQDAVNNCDAGLGGISCVNNNFEFYYCRDAGSEGTANDLPAILVDPVTRGQANTNTTTPLKEFFFLRENTPAITTLSVVDQTSGAGGGRVFATWLPVAGADGYKLYYGLKSGDYPDSLDTGLSASRLVTGLTIGQSYYFAVTAYYTVSNAESDYSNEAQVTPTDATPPAAPSGLSATAGTGQVDLSWTANTDDTTAYLVHYGATAGSYGSSDNVGTVTSLTITNLSSGTTYYFTVSAVDGYNNESALSAEVNAAPL